MHLCIEVSNQDESVAGVGVLGNDPHDIVGGGGSDACPFRADGLRAVVVHEEYDKAAAVLQACPLRSALADVRPGRILPDVLPTRTVHNPPRCPVGDAEGTLVECLAEDAVLSRQSSVRCFAHESSDVLGILEAQNVILIGWRCRCDLGGSHAIHAACDARLAEVVRQDLHCGGAQARRARSQKIPSSRGLAHLAPQPCAARGIS
mmetsp:Transcript_39304/g.108407  ORF Transcript_39304/g.108407 Transcript_39304/m.108407 type:complete len:205 (-) Transcript_39304:402-1016(-)